MIKVGPWLKAHWPIPVLTVVAVAALPTAMYFAAQMHEKFKAAYQTAITNDMNSVAPAAAQQKYGVPAWDGNGNVLERTGPVNEIMIAAYKTVLEDLQKKVGIVSEKGLAFNKGEHKLIMDGLFPAPAADASAQNLGREFISKYIEYHKKLLADARAGEPAKAEDIAKQLNDHATSEIARIKAELGRDPNAEEQTRLSKELVGMRLNMVRKRASELGVYADVSVFEGLPTSVPEKAPSPGQEWDMQERSWIDQDICHAVALANGPAGSGSGVPTSVVKRILKISIKPAPWDTSAPTPATYEPGDDKVPLNFAYSLTGRTSGPGTRNKWYDVRTVNLELVVSSQKLPRFLNALAATNFMTVLDLDITNVDPLVDLRAGYDYGDEHVVKATMVIETVWLREWRKAVMPEDVRKALAMVEGVDAGVTPGAAPPPPPSNRPPRPNPAGGAPGRPGGGPDAAPGGRGRSRGDG